MAYNFDSTTTARLAAFLRRMEILNPVEYSEIGSDQILELRKIIRALDAEIILEDNQQVTLWLLRTLNSAAAAIAGLAASSTPCPPCPPCPPPTELAFQQEIIGIFDIYNTDDLGESSPGAFGAAILSFPNLTDVVEIFRFSFTTDVESIELPELVSTGAAGINIQGHLALLSVAIPSFDIDPDNSGGITIEGNAALTTIDISNATLAGTAIGTVDFRNNALSETNVNAILVKIASFLPTVNEGTLQLEGGTNAAPSGAGAAAKTALIANGLTVTTN